MTILYLKQRCYADIIFLFKSIHTSDLFFHPNTFVLSARFLLLYLPSNFLLTPNYVSVSLLPYIYVSYSCHESYFSNERTFILLLFLDMGIDNWLPLGRLRRAVKKVRLLLNLNMNRWRIASMIRRSSGKHSMSFNERPGLMGCTDETDYFSSPDRGLQRTISYPGEEDINKRADMFIANFYNQLRIERQVSLELRYGKNDSFKSASP